MEGKVFQKYRSRIRTLETENEDLQKKIYKSSIKIEELKAMLSESRCPGNHCYACKNYYTNGFLGICAMDIKCRDFEQKEG